MFGMLSSLFGSKSLYYLLGIGSLVALALSAFVVKELNRDVALATASVGVVQKSRPTEPVRRPGFFSFFGIGPSQVDRIEVTTSQGRYVISGPTAFPEGSAVEVRDTPIYGRQLCSKSPPSCALLWSDASPLKASTTPDAGMAAFLSIIFKWVFPIILGLTAFAVGFRFGAP
jgi:hypothetical protein